MINVILTIGYTVLLFMTIAIVGLYCSQQHTIKELERGLKTTNADSDRLRREIRILKERAASQADKLVIVHEYDESQAPKFGNF